MEKKQLSGCHHHLQLICPDCSEKGTRLITDIKKTLVTMLMTEQDQRKEPEKNGIRRRAPKKTKVSEQNTRENKGIRRE